MIPEFQNSKKFANGWFFEEEGEWYRNICKNIFNGNILEIGSFEGLSLSFIKDTIISNKNKIYSIESFCRPRLIENTKKWNVNLICKNSQEASKDFPNNFFDFIYIDGDHSYKSVKNDILLWIPKLKKHGILGGHDYDWSGVKKAVNEIFSLDFKLSGRNWIVNSKKIFKYKKSKIKKIIL